jgi:hypothetical protein
MTRSTRDASLSVHFDNSLNWQREEEKSQHRSQQRTFRRRSRASLINKRYHCKLWYFLRYTASEDGGDVRNMMYKIANKTYLSIVLEDVKTNELVSK